MRGFDVHLDPDLDEEAAYATEGVENRCDIRSAHAESLHVVACIAGSLRQAIAATGCAPAQSGL